MSEAPTPLPANPSLEQLQKQAKDRVRELRTAGDANATLADVQFAIAREHGFESWTKLKAHIQSRRPPGIKPFEQLANDLAAAYMSLVRAINSNFGMAFPTDFHDAEKVKQCMATWYASGTRSPELAVLDARQMVAHAYSFETWEAFAASITRPAPDPQSAPVFLVLDRPFIRSIGRRIACPCVAPRHEMTGRRSSPLSRSTAFRNWKPAGSVTMP